MSLSFVTKNSHVYPFLEFFLKGLGSEARPVDSNPVVPHFLASQIVFLMKKFRGEGLRSDLETPQGVIFFNSSESVFRVKNGGWFFCHTNLS